MTQTVELLAAALNDTQIQANEIQLGHDLEPVAERLLNVLHTAGYTITPVDTLDVHLSARLEDLHYLEVWALDCTNGTPDAQPIRDTAMRLRIALTPQPCIHDWVYFLSGDSQCLICAAHRAALAGE